MPIKIYGTVDLARCSVSDPLPGVKAELQPDSKTSNDTAIVIALLGVNLIVARKMMD